jgi:hypothetical protein
MNTYNLHVRLPAKTGEILSRRKRLSGKPIVKIINQLILNYSYVVPHKQKQEQYALHLHLPIKTGEYLKSLSKETGQSMAKIITTIVDQSEYDI